MSPYSHIQITPAPALKRALEKNFTQRFRRWGNYKLEKESVFAIAATGPNAGIEAEIWNDCIQREVARRIDTGKWFS